MMPLKDRVNNLVVIGIDKYNSDSHRSLKNSVFDCKSLVKELTENYSFNLILELYNEQATRQRIIDELTFLSATLLEDDNLIIYFAGHGSINSISKKGFWIPYDASNSTSSYIANSQIKDLIDDINVQHIFLISDSCFSGTFLTRTRGVYNESSHYQKLDENKSRWYLASGREEPVNDGKDGEGSPFASSLLKVLTENSNEYISVLEIINQVSKLTGSQSKQQPVGGSINDIGHKGGQMVLIKKALIQFSRERFNKLMKTYGFVIGQRISLEKILLDFPELSVQVAFVKIIWEQAFGNSVNHIIGEIKTMLGDKWDEYNNKITLQSKELLAIQKIDYFQALEFIGKVEQRAKGAIESPILEVILTNIPEFKNNPILEYTKPYRQILESHNNPKAKGLDFTIEFPLSWSRSEGKRPNVLWLLVNFYGNVSATIVVNNLLNKFNIEQEDIDGVAPEEVADILLSFDFLKSNYFENFTSVTHERTLIDGCHVGIIDGESKSSRAGINLSFYSRNYFLVYKNFWLEICFWVSKEDGLLHTTKEAYSFFFNQIMNSLIILNKWK